MTTELINIKNLRNIKKAKVVLNDLELILKTSLTAYYCLYKFKHYKMVSRVLSELNTNKGILENSIAECKKIIDNKGILE